MQTPAFIDNFRSQFPFFVHQQTAHTESAQTQAYLDNAATTHICQPALDAINRYYQLNHANVHRSSHQLALNTSNQFETIRKQTASWLNAADKNEIVWTKGATEAANLIANGLCRGYLKAGDETIIALSEHHAHFVTWQQLAKQFNLILKIAPLTENLTIDLSAFSDMLSSATKVVAFAHVNNATGVRQPIEKILELSKKFPDIVSIIDGSQAVNHINIDVQALDCDFYFFSGHKMYAGTGLGVCYGKKQWLNLIPPYQFGGEMVKKVSETESEFNQLPYKFEAGTPNIASVFAFGATLSFLENVPLNQIREYEKDLMAYLIDNLKQVDNLVLLADKNLAGAVSFKLTDLHSADAAELLNQMGISLRAGNHCAMPLIQQICPQGSLRVSIAGYTSVAEVDYFLSCLAQLKEFI